MNKEITEESHCIIDGIPLSDSEIALIRVMRKHRIYDVLGGEEKEFSVTYIDDNYKLAHLDTDSCVVIDLSSASEAQEDVAKVFEQIKDER